MTALVKPHFLWIFLTLFSFTFFKGFSDFLSKLNIFSAFSLTNYSSVISLYGWAYLLSLSFALLTFYSPGVRHKLFIFLLSSLTSYFVFENKKEGLVFALGLFLVFILASSGIIKGLRGYLQIQSGKIFSLFMHLMLFALSIYITLGFFFTYYDYLAHYGYRGPEEGSVGLEIFSNKVEEKIKQTAVSTQSELELNLNSLNKLNAQATDHLPQADSRMPYLIAFLLFTFFQILTFISFFSLSNIRLPAANQTKQIEELVKRSQAHLSSSKKKVSPQDLDDWVN